MTYKVDIVSNKAWQAHENHDAQEFESSANESNLSDVRGVAGEGFIQLDNLIL